MKKRLLALFMIGCMSVSLAACGSDKTEESEADAEVVEAVDEGSEAEETPAPSVDGAAASDGVTITTSTVEELGIDAFVTVGEYKGLELERTVYEVTDEEVDTQIATEVASMPLSITDPSEKVEMGDVINLDYSGSIDGVVFEGGTAQGYSLEIGSGSFIDDFEEQLVGMAPGESGQVEVTFPEEYHSADLAGKDAVFEVTVNSIEVYVEEATEEWLAQNTAYTSLDEYKEGTRASLEASYAQTAESELYVNAFTAVMDAATFHMYPQDLLDDCFNEQVAAYENYATMYGFTYEEFLETSGMTEDDIKVQSETNAKTYLLLLYICENEGITEDSEEYQNTLNTMLAYSGLSTMEEAIEYGISEFNIDYSVRYEVVNNFLVENAIVTEVEASTDAAVAE